MPFVPLCYSTSSLSAIASETFEAQGVCYSGCIGVAAIKHPMAEQKAKYPRPHALQSRLPFISGNALAGLLRIAKDESLPQAASTRSLRRVRDKDVHVDTPYGKLHQVIELPGKEGPIQTEIQHPLAIIYYMASVSECFSTLLASAAASSSPACPLHIVLYADEVHPGNVLAVTSERKIWAWYWSCLEFGAAALADEDTDMCYTQF